MNNLLKALLSLLGGFNVIFSILSPIALVIILVQFYSMKNLGILLYIVGLCATIYRAIEIGWLPILKGNKIIGEK